MHYSAKLRAQLSASKIRYFRYRGLRYDFGDGFASFADVNLTELGGFSDPFTGFVMKFADCYRLHVTHMCHMLRNLSNLPSFGPRTSARRRCRRGAAFSLRNLERQFAVGRNDVDVVAGFDVAAEQFFRERIFKKTFNSAPHRSGAILGIVSFFDEKFFRALQQLDMNFLRFNAR